MNKLVPIFQNQTDMTLKERYLFTLRDALCGELYDDVAIVRPFFLRKFLKHFTNLHVGRRLPDPSGNRSAHWQLNALTQVGKKRLDNFQFCIESVIKNNVSGAIVECGVWRGGASIYAKGVLEVNKSSRPLYLFDSFEGLPKSRMIEDMVRDWTHCSDYLAVDLETVQNNFKRYKLLDSNVILVKGWFRDTLPPFKQPIAVLRADGDMYESTMDILVNLYPVVQSGGYVIIDDYCIDTCKLALEDYFKFHGLKIPELIEIDGRNTSNYAVYFQKP
jgi:O-methyltransferase